MSTLNPDLEVMVTPLDPAKDLLNGTYPALVFDDFRLLLSRADLAKLQALVGTDLSGRRIMLAQADDGVRIRIRLVPS